MKYLFFLLCATVLISCSNNKTSDASTTTDQRSTDPSASLPSTTAMTDKERAQITEQFLVFNAKEIWDMKSDDCNSLVKSLRLLYARQILYDRFSQDIPASADITQLISILENKMNAQHCINTDNPDINFGVKTEGGQLAFQIKIPTETAIWAVLTSEQRALVLNSVPPATRDHLMQMETKYSENINKIREVPTVIKVRPSAYVRPEMETPAVIIREKTEEKTMMKARPVK